MKTTSLMVRCVLAFFPDLYRLVPDAIGEPGARQEVRNERALLVYNRVQHKLTGASTTRYNILN